MRLSAPVACIALLLPWTASPQAPRRLTAPGESPAVWGVLEVPRNGGPHAGLILLPGSGGWRADYAMLARQFADSGFVTLALDYHAETGPTPPTTEARQTLWPRWEAAIRKAAEYLATMPAVDGRKVALIGFSQGASLAVSVAPSIPSVGAIVAFFGGTGSRDIKRLPPLLILHGEDDTIVPVQEAYRLRAAAVARGGDVEMRVYPKAGHSFTTPGQPGYSAEAAQDGWQRTVDFLRRKLSR